MYALSVKELKTKTGVRNLAVKQDTLECVGCEKREEVSFLYEVCGGMHDPQFGAVEVYGRELYRMDRDERAVFRRRNIGMVGAVHNLLPGLTLFENMTLPLALDGRRADVVCAKGLAEMADLKAGWKEKADRLSGAARQKAAVIRAVLSGASLLLVERDPDMEYWAARDVMRFVKYVQEEYGMTAVVFGLESEE